MHPLVARVADHRPGAIDDLRAALAAAAGPLRDGDTTTFVWEGTATRVGLQCGLLPDTVSIEMERVAGTDVWHRTLPTPSDVVLAYRYVADDPFLDGTPTEDAQWIDHMLRAQASAHADPANPRRIAPLASLFGLEIAPDAFESVLVGPDAPDDRWFLPHDAPAGTIEAFDVTSSLMGQTRTLTVWSPVGDGGSLPLVLLLDGSSFLHIAGMPRALDLAVANGDLPPAVVVFVHEAQTGHGLLDRTVEMTCNPTYAAMLADEIVPLLRDRLPVSPRPEHTVLGGASLGGLASAHAALTHADVIGNVLSVSGSYWWGVERDGDGEWLTRQLDALPAPLRIYQQIGRLEDNSLAHTPGVTHLQANRRFHEAAVARGHEVVYEELSTAHDICAFRIAAIRGLRALLS